MPKSIFTVTTIHIMPRRRSKRSWLNSINHKSRTVGWYSTKAKADDALVMNGHLAENGYYRYAVVEVVKEGIYPQVGRMGHIQWWESYINITSNREWEWRKVKPPGTLGKESICWHSLG